MPIAGLRSFHLALRHLRPMTRMRGLKARLWPPQKAPKLKASILLTTCETVIGIEPCAPLARSDILAVTQARADLRGRWLAYQ